jgi:anti-anti-sigma factor
VDINVRQKDGFGVVSVKGRIIRENQGSLRKALEDLAAQGIKGVALDFASVDYMDSAGLGCCASAQKLLHDKGGAALAVFGASQNVQRMWRLIRLDLVIPVLKDETEALSWLSSRTKPEAT